MRSKGLSSEKTKPAKANRRVVWRISLGYTAALLFLLVDPSMSQSPTVPNNKPFLNPSGFAATFSTNGSIDLTNEFFQDLGRTQVRNLSPAEPGLDRDPRRIAGAVCKDGRNRSDLSHK